MASPLTAEDVVYGLKTAMDPQIAPDGARIVYTLVETSRETQKPSSQVWLCDRDGANARRLTWSGDNNGSARWSPDGSQLAFLSDRNGKSGLFVLAPGGEAREVTSHATPISGLAWSPDGTQLAYLAVVDPANPDEQPPDPKDPPQVRVTRRLDYKQDMRGFLGDTRNQVFVVDVASGERRRVSRDARDHGAPGWSPDGRTLGATQMRMGEGRMHMALLLFDLQDAEAAPTEVGFGSGTLGMWSWSPSGDRILFAADPSESACPDFYIYDVAGGATCQVTDDVAATPGSLAWGLGAGEKPIWLDERQALYIGGRNGANGLYVLDTEQGSLEPVVAWQAAVGGINADRALRYFVGSRTGFDDWGELIVHDAQTHETSIITHVNDALLADKPAARAEQFQFERNGYTIEAWLLFPTDFDPSKKYPVVLDIHGGPSGSYGPAMMPWQQVIATNGFLTVISNPRGSTTYGRAFAKEVFGHWGTEDYLDLMAVVDKVLERPYADATRTGIWGYSYGGFMTSWILGQTDRFQACVCGAPVFDMVSMYGTSDIGVFGAELHWGGKPHEQRDKLLACSPATFAHRAKTPTLIIQGEADERCPVGQAEQMFVELKQAGVEVEFARYPGGGHLFLIAGPPKHRIDMYQRSLDWFKEHLGEPS